MPVASQIPEAALAPFLAKIEAEQDIRRHSHEAEIRRQALSGLGVDLAPFIPMTKAEKRAEAKARAIRFASPEAVLKRGLIAAANAGSYEAERLYAASCRGDIGWQDRAHTLLALKAAA